MSSQSRAGAPLPGAGAPGWKLFLLVLVSAAGLNLLWLWDAPLADTTEARHAQVGREFAEDGHWLVPALNRRPHLTKPPLTDWLVALGIKLFGANEFGARFFGALVAAVGLALVFGFAYRLGGRRTALAAGCFYLCTPVYLVLSRTISIDIILATFATGAFWAAWELSRKKPTRPRIVAAAFWICLGLGALAKGHIVLLVVLLPVVAWILAGKRWRLAQRLFCTPAIVIFPLLALPWYVYIAWNFPGWLGRMAFNELSQRTMGAEFGDANFGLSVLYFLGGALLCVPVALPAFFRERDAGAEGAVDRGALGLLASWIGLPLLVFSVVSAQRVNYIAPLVPAAAVLAGLGWSRLSVNWASSSVLRRAPAYSGALAMLLFALGCAAACHTTTEIEMAALVIICAGATLLAAASVVTLACLLRAQVDAAGKSAALAVLAMWLISLGATGAVKHHRSMREACGQLSRADIPDPFCFKKYFASAHFYMGDSLRLCDVNLESSRWPEGTVRTRHELAQHTHREVYNQSRSESGSWLLAIRLHEEDLRKFAASRHMRLHTCWSRGELMLVRALARPPRVAPGPAQRGSSPGQKTISPPGPAQSLRELMEQLGAGDPQRRSTAAKRLADLKEAAEPALPLLIAALGDRDPAVRFNAARALGKIPDPGGRALHALRSSLRDPDWQVRRYAASSLGELKAGDQESAAALIDALKDEDWEVRRVAARSLGSIRASTPGAVSGLTRLLGDEYWQARMYAARSLGRLGPKAKSALPELRRLLSDPEPKVRQAAKKALGLVAPKAEKPPS